MLDGSLLFIRLPVRLFVRSSVRSCSFVRPSVRSFFCSVGWSVVRSFFCWFVSVCSLRLSLNCSSLASLLPFTFQNSIPMLFLSYSFYLQIVLGLRYIHKEKHIVHRDLTPNNIMLGGNDKVTISKWLRAFYFSWLYKVIYVFRFCFGSEQFRKAMTIHNFSLQLISV